jgi:hypothetical protein
LAVVDELRDNAAEAGWARAACDLPPDVHAEIKADLDVITADNDRLLTDQAAYETELAALHTSSPPAAPRTEPRTGPTAEAARISPKGATAWSAGWLPSDA